MTTPAYILQTITHATLLDMADNGDFVAQGNDAVRPIQPAHVIIRDTTSDREADDGDTGERNILKPGLIVTYVSARFPDQAGQNCQDDGSHRVVVQLIDDVAPKNTQRSQSYFWWMNIIRKKLQENPYRTHLLPEVADIFLIHVDQISPGQNLPYRLHQQMKAGLQITAYAREHRT